MFNEASYLKRIRIVSHPLFFFPVSKLFGTCFKNSLSLVFLSGLCAGFSMSSVRHHTYVYDDFLFALKSMPNCVMC